LTNFAKFRKLQNRQLALICKFPIEHSARLASCRASKIEPQCIFAPGSGAESEQELTKVRWRRSKCWVELAIPLLFWPLVAGNLKVFAQLSSCAIIELDSLIVVDSNLIANSRPLNFQLSC